jgi:hypothetical protein
MGMRLPGRLSLTTLGDILGSLYRAHASGVLELVEQSGVASGRRHRVYFNSGLVEDVDSHLVQTKLGELLRREGLLGPSALTRLTHRLLENPGKRAGDILIEEGLATADLVLSGLRKQLRSKLDALFRLGDASVRFHVPRPRRHDGPEPLTPHEFLYGRPRARVSARDATTPPNARPYRARVPMPSLDPKLSRAYSALGVTPGADRATIQRAFRKLASATHPDRFPSAPASERARLLTRFAELSAAYHTLIAA